MTDAPSHLGDPLYYLCVAVAGGDEVEGEAIWRSVVEAGKVDAGKGKRGKRKGKGDGDQGRAHQV